MRRCCPRLPGGKQVCVRVDDVALPMDGADQFRIIQASLDALQDKTSVTDRP